MDAVAMDRACRTDLCIDNPVSLRKSGGCHRYQYVLMVFAGKHLSEHCKAEYPTAVNYCLWVLAEVAVIAADIPEVMGTAFALNILFHFPIWVGVLLAGLNTLLLLAVQRYGIRKLEVVIAVLLLVLGGCFFTEMAHARPDMVEIAKGMFIPKLDGNEAAQDAIALLGALVMPHNLYLHSALVISRKIPHSHRGINDACKYFLVESGFALFVAFLINVAVVSVSGSICYNPKVSSPMSTRCEDVTLSSSASLLKVIPTPTKLTKKVVSNTHLEFLNLML
ncbi:Metal transporter Nramp1 [Acorus gramineus]|uniref:Metal transporter Nramp1 n=1 Tax=Acorus gramineus TaxID=55184 RepID=A0AAV9ABZ9_ACOGR|nr:Metal transporter Nramp1 [Acorus gramineus]